MAVSERRELEIRRALQAGVSPREELTLRRELIVEPAETQRPLTATQEFLQTPAGFAEGLLPFLNLPGQALESGLQRLGTTTPEFLKFGPKPGQLEESIAEAVPPSQTGLGRIARKTGQFGGAALPAAIPAVRLAQAPLRLLATETIAPLTAALGGEAAEATGGVSRPTGEFIGSLGASGVPAVSGAVSRGVARGGRAGREFLGETVEKFARRGETPTLGQASRSRFIRGTQNILERTQILGPRLTKRLAQQEQNIGNQIDNITQGLAGQGAVSPERAGRVVGKGLQDFIERSRIREKRLYKTFFDVVPENSKSNLQNSFKVFDDIDNRGFQHILDDPKLPNIKARFREGQSIDIPFEEFKRFRSKVGQKLSGIIPFPDIDRGEAKRLYAALSKDMLDTASRVGGDEAVKRFRVANAFSVRMHGKSDTVLKPLLRKKSVEEVFDAIKGDALARRQRGTKVARVMAALKPQERKIVSAAVIDEMGRAPPGQAVKVDEFSFETFLTHWNRMSRNTKRALFSVQPGLAKQMDDIADIAGRVREVSATGRNPSETAQRIFNTIGIASIPGVGIAAFFSPQVAASLGIGLVSGRLANRALASPRVVKWLARSTKLPLNSLPGHIARLSAIVKNEDVEVQEAAQELTRVFRESLNIQ